MLRLVAAVDARWQVRGGYVGAGALHRLQLLRLLPLVSAPGVRLDDLLLLLELKLPRVLKGGRLLTLEELILALLRDLVLPLRLLQLLHELLLLGCRRWLGCLRLLHELLLGQYALKGGCQYLLVLLVRHASVLGEHRVAVPQRLAAVDGAGLAWLRNKLCGRHQVAKLLLVLFSAGLVLNLFDTHLK